MPDESITQEEYNKARAELEHHIKEFIAIVDPGEYLLHWELLVHKTSIDMERQGTSAMGMHGSADMTFIERRGLLAMALQTDEDRTR